MKTKLVHKNTFLYGLIFILITYNLFLNSVIIVLNRKIIFKHQLLSTQSVNINNVSTIKNSEKVKRIDNQSIYNQIYFNAGSNVPTQLDKTAKQVLQVIKYYQWGKLRQYCMPVIAFGQYRVMYPSSNRTPDYPDSFYGDYANPDSTDGNAFCTQLINTKRQLDSQTQSRLSSYFAFFNRCFWDQPKISIECNGDYSPGFLFEGISKHLIAGSDACIGFCYDGKKWRINQIVMSSQ